MSILSKRKAGGPGTPMDQQIGPEQAAADLALDTLAAVLRVYGDNGFDIEGMDAAELERRCNAWVRHILTGTPAPQNQESSAEPPNVELLPPNERHWADLQRFVRAHRYEEQSWVTRSAEQMRGLITEVASGLRSAITDDAAKDKLVTRELSALSDAVQGNSLPVIRAQVNKTIELVSAVVRERQARYEAQLRSMSQRIRNLRADLVAMRERVSLDPLTQVHNRGAFDGVLAKQIDFSFLSGQPLALMMIDLDHFKQINDVHGHPGGDLVLRVTADAIVRACPRRSDFVARYGGEEFAVIFVDVTQPDLEPVSKRLLRAIRDLSVEYRDASISLTCSIGIATLRTQDNAETLLQRADQALYRAKNTGRDKAVIADPC